MNISTAPFALDSDVSDLPKSTHPDKHLFKPTSPAKLRRQKIWSHLLENQDDGPILLRDIAKATGLNASQVYSGAIMLCRTGFAKRHDIWIEGRRKKSLVKVPRIAISYIAPWSTKIGKKW